jgi:predicted RNA-binding Zn-ribbon protein involved in translation (DUF1610 family)
MTKLDNFQALSLIESVMKDGVAIKTRVDAEEKIAVITGKSDELQEKYFQLLANLGSSYEDNKDIHSALLYYKKIYNFGLETEDKMRSELGLIMSANVYLEIDDYDNLDRVCKLNDSLASNSGIELWNIWKTLVSSNRIISKKKKSGWVDFLDIATTFWCPTCGDRMEGGPGGDRRYLCPSCGQLFDPKGNAVN